MYLVDFPFLRFQYVQQEPIILFPLQIQQMEESLEEKGKLVLDLQQKSKASLF